MTMKKTAWKRKIVQQTKAVGTYKEAFEPVIITLAGILEQRDQVYEQYIEEGAEPLHEYTNKNGSTNLTKNPLLVLWDELNKSALTYWRDLGLTPAGLKKIDEQSMKPKKVSALAEALKSIG